MNIPQKPLKVVPASAEEELKQRLRQLEAIYHMTATVSRAANLEQIYEAALDCLQDTLHIDRASVLLFDENGVMRFQAWRSLSQRYRQFVDGHSPWSPTEKDPRPIVVANVAEEPSLAELRDVILAEGICALGFIPLVSQGRLLGKFMLYYNAPHEFEEDEIHLAESIAGQVAFAIDRKQADEALQEAKDELERRVEARTALLKSQIAERKRTEEALRKEKAFVQLLQKVAVAANEAATVEAALQFALDEVCAHMGWPVGHVFVSAEDGTGEVVSASLWCLEDTERFKALREVTEVNRFGPGEGLPGRVLIEGEPVW
ncbi:MAG TPA: GAF domain-containing protein, partial [Anaerolineae bacterium]